MAMGLGLVLGFVLFATLFEGFSRISWPKTINGSVVTGTSHGASRWAYQVTPWFHEFRGRALNLRALMVPFTDLELGCDSQTPPGADRSCSGGRQNSHGFRVPEYTIAHPPGTFRIVIVGDSNTWGDGIEAEDLYHQMLQKRFDETHSSGKPRVEVVALGISGSNIWDNVTRLLVHGEQLRPDLVLVQFFENDLDYRGYQALLREDLDEDRLDYLLEWTALGRRLESRQLLALTQAERAQRYDPESLEWRLFEDSLKALAGWKQARKVPVAFLTFPPVSADPEVLNFDYLSDVLGFHQQAEDAIEREGFPLLRILDTFRARADGRYLAVSRTNAHYNAFANELVAEAIHEFLTTADWVDLESVPEGVADERWAAEQALRRRSQDSWSEFYRSYELQRELFEQLVELFPENAWLTQSLAFVLRELGDMERSRALYLRLAELEPLQAAPWYDLAEGTQDPTEVEALLVRMLVEVPDHIAAVEKLAGLDVAAGRIGRACGCYSRVTKLSNFPEQFSRGFEAFRRHECDTVPAEPCPGLDPLRHLSGAELAVEDHAR
jgi:lysophospholipase L1-like esterase